MATSFQQRPQNLFGSNPSMNNHGSASSRLNNTSHTHSASSSTAESRATCDNKANASSAHSASTRPPQPVTTETRGKVAGCAIATVYIKMKTQETIGLGTIVGRHLELRLDEKKRILRVRSQDRSKPDINIYKKDIHSVDKDEVEYGIIGMETETYRVTLNLNNESYARKIVNWLSGRRVELERCKKCKGRQDQDSPAKAQKVKSEKEGIPQAKHSDVAGQSFEQKPTTPNPSSSHPAHSQTRDSGTENVHQSTGNTPSKKNLFGSKSTGNILGSSRKSMPASTENITRNTSAQTPSHGDTAHKFTAGRVSSTPNKAPCAYNSPTEDENQKHFDADKSPMRTNKSAKSGPKSGDSRLNADGPKKLRLSDISPVRPKAKPREEATVNQTQRAPELSTKNAGTAKQEAPSRKRSANINVKLSAASMNAESEREQKERDQLAARIRLKHELKKAEMAEKMRRKKEKATTSAPSVDPEAIRESRMKAEREKQRAAEERADTQQRAQAKSKKSEQSPPSSTTHSPAEPTPAAAAAPGAKRTKARVSQKQSSGHDSGFGFADMDNDSEPEYWPFESSQSPSETPSRGAGVCEEDDERDIFSHKAKPGKQKKTGTRKEKKQTQAKDSPMEGLFSSTNKSSARVPKHAKMHSSTPVDDAQPRKRRAGADSPIDLVSPIKPASRTKSQDPQTPASATKQSKKPQHSKVPTPAPDSQNTTDKPTKDADATKESTGPHGSGSNTNAEGSESTPDLLTREGVLRLEDAQIDALSVKKLKQALDTLGVSWTGCVEKQHLRTLLRESIKNPPPASAETSQNTSSEKKPEPTNSENQSGEKAHEKKQKDAHTEKASSTKGGPQPMPREQPQPGTKSYANAHTYGNASGFTPDPSFESGAFYGRPPQQLVPCWGCHGTSYKKLIKVSGLCNTCHTQQRRERKAAAAEEERRAKAGETLDAEEQAREQARKQAQAEYEREQREKTLAQQRIYDEANREALRQAQMRAAAEAQARAQAAAHARAQEAAYREQLRQQRERIERERQEKIRREQEARSRSNPRSGAQFKPPGGFGGENTVHDLDAKWEHFASAIKKPIKHHHIPWPGPNAPGLSRQDTAATAKKKIRKATLRWHPDKFIAKFGDALCPIDRSKILQQVNETFHAITKSKQNLDANPSGGGAACAQM